MKAPVLGHHDLDALAGTWNAAEARAFEKATAAFGAVDETLWRRALRLSRRAPAA